MKELFSIMSNLQTWYHYREQVVNPRHQTPQEQSDVKPGTLLLNIVVENLTMV